MNVGEICFGSGSSVEANVPAFNCSFGLQLKWPAAVCLLRAVRSLPCLPAAGPLPAKRSELLCGHGSFIEDITTVQRCSYVICYHMLYHGSHYMLSRVKPALSKLSWLCERMVNRHNFFICQGLSHPWEAHGHGHGKDEAHH